MGREARGAQGPALDQTGLTVWPTRTVYDVRRRRARAHPHVHDAVLPHDLDVLSRPATYLTWDAVSTDGRPHDVALYFDASSELAVNTPDQPVTWGRLQLGDSRCPARRLARPAGARRNRATTSGSTGAISTPCPPRRTWPRSPATATPRDAALRRQGHAAGRRRLHRPAAYPARPGVVLAFAWQMRGVASQPVHRASGARVRRRVLRSSTSTGGFGRGGGGTARRPATCLTSALERLRSPGCACACSSTTS